MNILQRSLLHEFLPSVCSIAIATVHVTVLHAQN